MKEVAPLRYDVIFKKAFSHAHLFTGLVQAFLNIELEIDTVENDKVFTPAIGSVAPHFDLFAEDKKNRVIVEVQHAHYDDTYERFLYYQCAAMVETIISSSNYRFPITVITIVFLTGKKTPSPDSGILVHDFEPRDGVTNLLLDRIYPRKHRLIFVFTSAYDRQGTPEASREWMRAIHDSLDEQVDETTYQNALITELFQLIEKDNVTPEERARMKDEYNIEEDKKKSRQEGIQEGIQEGVEKMLRSIKERSNLTDEQIAAMTDLPLETVKNLQ